MSQDNFCISQDTSCLLQDTLDVTHVGVRKHEKVVKLLGIKKETPLLSTGIRPMEEKVLEEIRGYFYFS